MSEAQRGRAVVPELTDKSIVQQAKRMRNCNTAAGLSGFSQRLLSYCMIGADSLAEATRDLVRKLAKATDLPYDVSMVLHSAYLAMPAKNDKGEVRPLGLGEVPSRCGTALLCRQNKEVAAKAFGKHGQFGVGVENGVEATIHLTRGLVQSGSTLITLDAENAFNSYDRVACHEFLSQNFPTLINYVESAYSKETPLVFRGDDGQAAGIISSVGSRQGDPAGPLMFACALAPVMEHVLHHHPDVYLLAIMDDVSIVGEPEAAAAAAACFMRAFAEFTSGRIRPEKSFVYSEVHTAAQLVAAGVPGTFRYRSPLKSAVDHQGLRFLGGALGSPAYVEMYVAAAIDKTIAKMETVLDVKSAQDRLAAFQQSLQHSHVFQLRVNEIPATLGPVLRAAELRYEKMIYRLLRSLTGRPVGADARYRASLPVDLGGLGLFLCFDLAAASYSASYARALTDMCARMPDRDCARWLGQGADTPARRTFDRQLAAAQTFFGPRPVLVYHGIATVRRLQGKFSRALFEARYADIRQTLSTSASTLCGADLAAFDDFDPFLFKILPGSDPRLRLGNAKFRVLVLRRLLLPLTPYNGQTETRATSTVMATCPLCRKAGVADIFGDHPLCCQLPWRTEVQSMLVRRAVAPMLRSANVLFRKEHTIGTTQRRSDLVVFDENGNENHADFTSVCHTAEHNLTVYPFANSSAEVDKQDDYAAALETADDARFFGCAVGLGGSRGPGFQTFLSVAVKDQLDGTASERAKQTLYWDRRVSVVVADVVAARLLSARGGEDVPAHAMHRGILDEARVMGLLQPHIPQASAMGSVRHDEVTASAP